jgi:hypothetical protein
MKKQNEPIMTRSVFWGLFLLLSACNTTERETLSIRRDFTRHISAPPTFDVATPEDTLHLPLPPTDAYRQKCLSVIRDCAQRAAAIEVQSLPEAGRAEWQQFCKNLEAVAVQWEKPPVFDPTLCIPDELLTHFTGGKGKIRYPALLTKLVAALPAYFDSVRQARPVLARPQIAAAAERGAKALEALSQLSGRLDSLSIGYREQLQRTIPAAQYALKDFISFCESGQIGLLMPPPPSNARHYQ